MILAKNTIKFITSLSVKKYRRQQACFIAEGPKITEELLHSSIRVLHIFAVSEWIKKNKLIIPPTTKVTEINEAELHKISQLETPCQVLAVAEIQEKHFDVSLAEKTLILTLDDIRDPGNLGTIIRIADWFGFKHVLCSEKCVDIYNPKAVQATMGSIARVDVYYENLQSIFMENNKRQKVYGAFLDGENIYEASLENNGYLVIGNESSGISNEIAAHISRRLFIPSGTREGRKAESLNASMAAAVICSEFLRRSLLNSKTKK